MANQPSSLSDDLREALGEFLIESWENLDQMDRDLLALEINPRSKELLDNIFRTVHTLKGSCGFFSFAGLESIAHAGENLLDTLRSGKLVFNREIATALLALSDAIRQVLSEIESSGSEGKNDFGELIILLRQLQVPMQSPGPAPTPATEAKSAELEDAHGPAMTDSIRVDISLLDKLMNLVGELVLARNQVLQLTSGEQGEALQTTSQRLNLITTELQESVMKTRMQPISTIWGKFPRVVRDLSLMCGKQVRLEMEGQSTETDKSIIEAIKDPLTHLLRNAVDHGIETPEQRSKRGKSAEGLISLRAYHEGGQVIIEMSDDGEGINVEHIKQSAQKKGLITGEQAAKMSEREATNLIFLPGLSTAETITNVSGRGVGMDVVLTNLEKIGGTVDIQSQPGRGTTFKIKIPLTLAIIPALIISCQAERYAIPQVSLLELLRLEGADVRVGIEMIHEVPVHRLRGKLLPLVCLSSLLRLNQGKLVPLQNREAVNIIVLKADDREFGLVVDVVHDTEEIVVKPLGKQLKTVSVFAGATIMGDGRVALILDVYNIAQAANIATNTTGHVVDAPQAEDQSQDKNQDELLIFQVGDRARMALPVAMVARLEEFPISSIEQSGRCEVVQYRGRIMPLIPLEALIYSNKEQMEAEPENDELPNSALTEPGVETDEALVTALPIPLVEEELPEPEAAPSSDSNDLVSVIVYTIEGHYVGLVVRRVLDIVSATVMLQREGRNFGILGSAVVHGHVTDLLDIHKVIETVDPVFFEETKPSGTYA